MSNETMTTIPEGIERAEQYMYSVVSEVAADIDETMLNNVNRVKAQTTKVDEVRTDLQGTYSGIFIQASEDNIPVNFWPKQEDHSSIYVAGCSPGMEHQNALQALHEQYERLRSSIGLYTRVYSEVKEYLREQSHGPANATAKANQADTNDADESLPTPLQQITEALQSEQGLNVASSDTKCYRKDQLASSAIPEKDESHSKGASVSCRSSRRAAIPRVSDDSDNEEGKKPTTVIRGKRATWLSPRDRDRRRSRSRSARSNGSIEGGLAALRPEAGWGSYFDPGDTVGKRHQNLG